MSIRRRLLLTALVGVVPLIVVGAIATEFARKSLAEEVRDGLSSVAAIEAGRVTESLAAMDDKLAALAGPSRLGGAAADHLESYSEPGRQELARELRAAVDDMSGLSAVSLYSADGRFIASSGEFGAAAREVTPATIDRVVRQDLADTRTSRYGDAFLAEDGEARYQHFLPMEASDGRVVGVLIAECTLTRLEQVLRDSWTLAETADIHLIQQVAGGGLQWVTPPRFAEDRVLAEPMRVGSSRSIAAESLRPTASLIDDARDYRGVAVIAAVHRIEPVGWGLVVKVDKEEADGPVRQLARTLLAVFVIAVTLVAALSLALSRSIIRRLDRLTEVATAIRGGDYGRRVSDPSRDEVGRLAEAFDTMTTQLADDIGRRRQAEAELEYQATHDALTGLPNRVLGYERLSTSLESAVPGRSSVAVLFCDLDQFKAVNDGLGHSVGDALLTEVAVRLRAGLRAGDTLVRFGGDEFVLISSGLSPDVRVSAIAARLQDALSLPFDVGAGKEVMVTVSIGSVCTDDPTANPEVLIREADAAMYRAKELGRDRHVATSDEIRDNVASGLSVLTDLRHVIETGGLTLDYQPVIDLESGHILGAEALVRWPHPERGLLQPRQFLDFADRHGLMPAIDRWVVMHACNQVMALRLAGAGDDFRVWVNVSATSLRSPAVVDSVMDALIVSGLDAPSLCLEVIEEAFAEGGAEPAKHLTQLRHRGVTVAVDDFGSGYSSLDRLRLLPVDYLKMDRGLVRDVDANAEARAVVSSVVTLSKALGMSLIAEGIERAEQAEVLRELGADAGQGYWFARPQSPADLLQLVLHRNASQHLKV